jgi:glycosyltransferase involved in cell wall biosynthesis
MHIWVGVAMPRAKIMYLDHAPLMGGAEHSLLYLIDNLDKSRFDPILACPPDSSLADQARSQGVDQLAVDMPRLRGGGNPAVAPGRLIRNSLKLARIIRRERVDIVHANVMRAALYGAVAASLARRRFIWHVRDIHHERAFVVLVGGLADRIIVISKAAREVLPHRFWLKTDLVYNGVDLQEYSRDKAKGSVFRDALGVGREVLLVGNVSWLAPWKGQHVFLKTAEAVSEKYPQARFVVVGDAADPSHAAYVEELRHRAAEMLGDRLIFTGPRSDIPEVMASLDVLVHTAEDEPFGRVFIEAMAMETPVVAMASGGASEVVADGETGLLVPGGDVKAVAEAVDKMLSDDELRAGMGRRGRERAERLFDARLAARRIEDIYESLL